MGRAALNSEIHRFGCLQSTNLDRERHERRSRTKCEKSRAILRYALFTERHVTIG
jgi:hypothetical protein